MTVLLVINDYLKIVNINCNKNRSPIPSYFLFQTMSFNRCFVCSLRGTRSYKILQEQLYHNFGVFPVTHTQIIYKSDYQMTGKCSNFDSEYDSIIPCVRFYACQIDIVISILKNPAYLNSMFFLL